MSKKLKLFVWEGVLTDWTSGIAFALAENVDQARDVIMQKNGEKSYKEAEHKGMLWKDISSDPLIIETPTGFYVWGGA